MNEKPMQKSTISATSKTIKPKGNVRRNSTWRITPGSSLSLSSSGIEVPSRYMRASVGSCHDLCKYGGRHVSEEANHPSLCSFLGNNAKSNAKKNLARSLMEARKGPVAKLKAASPQKAELSNDPQVQKETASSSKKTTNLSAPKVVNQKTPPSFKRGSTSPALQATKQNATSALKTVDMYANPAISSKTKNSIMKPDTSSNPLGAHTGRRHKENHMIKSLYTAEIGESKLLKPPIASLSPEAPVGSQEDAGEPEYSDAGIVEKTLHVIVQRNITDVEEVTDESESESIETSESESEDEETESSIKVSRGKDVIRQRRSATVHPEDKFSPPRKLKFRRGKVVELPAEGNAPRKLRFRKRRVANENLEGNGEVVKTSSTMMELDSAALNAPSSEAQGVVLRHQDVEEKKDAQGLFNHVIEETASKLVEMRKSKVKALVGAFETVISLQEIKPASAV